MSVNQAASGIVEALKTQPALLALIVVAFGLLGFTWYEGHTFNEYARIVSAQQQEATRLLAQCLPVEVQQQSETNKQIEQLRSAIEKLAPK